MNLLRVLVDRSVFAGLPAALSLALLVAAVGCDGNGGVYRPPPKPPTAPMPKLDDPRPVKELPAKTTTPVPTTRDNGVEVRPRE